MQCANGSAPPALPHPISAHLLAGFAKPEHDDERQHAHAVRKAEELNTARREDEWKAAKKRAQTIQPPSIQPIFTTSPDNFVRNHGTVPNLSWSQHQLAVSGVDDEYHRTYSMDSLSQLPQHSVVVTVACDGNRRKELNLIRHTNGFSWGSGAVSTAKWSGVRLVDVMHDVHIDRTYRGGDGLHLCFEAVDDLHSGHYGTSIDFAYCMDPRNDVLLALRQNDEPLRPDHGAPLRLIVPGMVGGRQVKWLGRIWVSHSATPNWYHHHDNKFLPSSVTTEAAAMSWWPRTPPLYEMCVQAVITQPTHQQWMDFTKPPEAGDGREGDKGQQYCVKGFAYSGGGHRIQRVELSLDRGRSWLPCKLQFVDGGLDEVSSAKSRNEKHWAWAFWSVSVPIHSFFHARDLQCRAFDSAFNRTSDSPAWNSLGVNNNSNYRVQVDYQSPSSVRFIHPVQPGQLTNNGWMRPPIAEGEKEHAGGFATDSFIGLRLISAADVAKHCTREDCWVIIDGRVYDFSSFLVDHPGGDWAILSHAGRNASAVFHDVHHDEVNAQKEMFLIGQLEPPQPPELLRPEAQKDMALSVFQWVKARLKKRVEVSPDVRLLTFDFPSAQGEKKKTLLPIGQHILIGASVGGHAFVVRPYGPVRPLKAEEDDGTLDVLLKVYFPTDKKPGGVLSCHLDGLREGDEVRIKGPTGPLVYEGKGRMAYQGRSFSVTHVNLVCGGTGIVPAYQLIRAFLDESGDGGITGIALLYSNKTPADILLRKELDELARKHHDRFHLFYTVDRVHSPEPTNGHKDNDHHQHDHQRSKQREGEEHAGAEAHHSPSKRQHQRKPQGDHHEGDGQGKGEHSDRWPFNVGHVDEALVRAHLFSPSPTAVCFVCGPPPMLQLAVYPALDQMGFDRQSQVLDC